MQIYTVKQGDTIDRIAGAAGMDPLRLAHDNQIEPPYRLAVGQSLLVAGGDSEEAGVRLGGFRIGNVQTGPVLVNGYAYPWIDEQILSETCMYLTSISIFSYGFTEAGELVPPCGLRRRRHTARSQASGRYPGSGPYTAGSRRPV